MAKDIAFAVGALSLLGDRVPSSLKIFLTALAIIDDLGAVLIIAIFCTHDFSLAYFGFSMIIFVLLMVLDWLKVKHLASYALPGIVMWYCMLRSGVHATTAGILLAFAIPSYKDESLCPSYRL